MEPEDFSVTVSGQEITLTRREYLILELLVRNPGKVFTKLAKANSGETYIQTVWGIGFKMK